ncbi:acyl carrier protein [Dactylosporangium sp. AC04546]|uniref:acyl carrier protein n=1 Tax=Dactylosporangium sp. AC04546 TaxID=2862460 RepID=UPI001EE0BC86|nr:acyl carrier protein [Dactylosporangium sp. AC04546]WVK88762.1 acyl carrier protein [Dactylosporangium sp. AC04546]
MPELSTPAPDLAATVREILVDDVYVASAVHEIALDDNLRDDHGLDSIGFLELRAQCERRFAVVISDDDFNPVNFASVRTVADLVRTLRQIPAAGIQQ